VIPSEVGVCSSETKQIKHERNSTKTKTVCSEQNITETKTTMPKKALGSSLDKDCFSSSESKHDRMVQKTELFQQDYRNKDHKPRTILGLSLSKDAEFRDNNINNNYCMTFNNMCQMIRPMVKLQAIKIDKKCKHMLNFPAITAGTLLALIKVPPFNISFPAFILAPRQP
jgi:hypothetical protein